MKRLFTTLSGQSATWPWPQTRPADHTQTPPAAADTLPAGCRPLHHGQGEQHAGISKTPAPLGSKFLCGPMGPTTLGVQRCGGVCRDVCRESGESAASVNYNAMGACFSEGEELLVPATVTVLSADPHTGAPPTGGGDCGRRVHPAGGLSPVHRRFGGRQLASSYVLEAKPLGEGSYGHVTVATHAVTGARRAVKSVHKAKLRRYTRGVLEFIGREVEILRSLNHPNIVKMYETFEDADHVHLVLELCEGGDVLSRIILERERLLECDVADLIAQILAAVQHMHGRGLAHRDLKPENSLFTRNEPWREPRPPARSPLKLIDFGLSRCLDSAVGARVTPKMGTTEYMSPEGFTGKFSCDQLNKVDMWSCGIVLHVILIGHFPSAALHRMSPDQYMTSSMWSHVSPSCRDFLAQLLRPDPAARPTASACLKHHWLSSWARKAAHAIPKALDLAWAVGTFSTAPDLQRLALAAAAREVDDVDVCDVRHLFVLLEKECNGVLTSASLRNLAHRLRGPLADAAKELVLGFDAIDLDISGTIGWSEVLAVALASVRSTARGIGQRHETDKDHALQGGTPPCGRLNPGSFSSSNSGAAKGGVVGDNAEPRLVTTTRDDISWRAFDLLSQGTGTVSADSLGSLFALSGPLACGNTTAITPRSLDFEPMVLEIAPSGSVDAQAFTHLIDGCGFGASGL